MGTPLALWLSNMFIEPLTSGAGQSVSDDFLVRQHMLRHRPQQNSVSFMSSKFQNPFGACNFIVTWNGEDVHELLEAIQYARESGHRFIRDKWIEYILNI